MNRSNDTGSAATNVVVGVLLLAPFVGLLWVSSYAKAEPRLFGFPFFYWYQLLWVFIGATCTAIAYVLVRRAELARKATRRHARTGRGPAGGRGPGVRP